MTKSFASDGLPLDFLVSRRDLRECKFVTGSHVSDEALHPGQVVLGLDKFGLTANNVTYAALGDTMGYWKFFPAPEGWGRIPVWGYADVLQSRHPEIAPGSRLYGYFPMSTKLIAQFGAATGNHFIETSPHRRDLPAVYNRYALIAPGRGVDNRAESLQAAFRPLFNTSFLLDDFLADRGFFEARNVIIGSASSKTALGLACLLSLRRDRPGEVIGLTSAANAEFVKRCGFFDRIATYDKIESIPNHSSAVFIDMSGNGDVVSAVHRHLGACLTYSCKVGLTHWRKAATDHVLPGVQPTLFFAPAQAQKRTLEWGAEGFLAQSDASWAQLTEMISGCVDVVHSVGHESVQRVYLNLLEQRIRPDQSHVLSWS